MQKACLFHPKTPKLVRTKKKLDRMSCERGAYELFRSCAAVFFTCSISEKMALKTHSGARFPEIREHYVEK